MATIQIGIIPGSLRKESYTRKIALAFSQLMPTGFSMQMIDIGALPLYNQDLDDDGMPPEAWSTFRKTVQEMDGYLFVSPEYNRSIPPVLKNALDVASRPYGENCWDAKPGAIISVSPGKQGAFGANHHLRQCMTFLNVYTMQQPEMYLGEVQDLLDETGNITNESTHQFLQSAADSFASWVRHFI